MRRNRLRNILKLVLKNLGNSMAAEQMIDARPKFAFLSDFDIFICQEQVCLVFLLSFSLVASY
ncbi:MAG TPA: hypothetical protein DCO86_03915 [Spirochaetaceae bacterium]|nr:hypothetical protein [Spirochaetaceae bacterium]HAL18749.1 hypothetical protein [Spirochaetaceae bacterium]